MSDAVTLTVAVEAPKIASPDAMFTSLSKVNFNPGGVADNHTSNGSWDVFITKYNSDGSYSWTKTFGGSGGDIGISIISDYQGNIFITGVFQDTVDFNPGGIADNHTSNGGEDIFISRLNSDGSYGWTKTFGGSGDDRGYSITSDNLGNIYITGRFDNTVNFNPGGVADNHISNGNDDAFITKYKPDGSYSWTKTFGGRFK